MGLKIDREFIARAARKGDIQGPNEFALVRDFVQKYVPGSEKLGFDGLHRLASRVYRALADGEEIELDDTGVPEGAIDLSPFAGTTELERMINRLVALEPGFASLDPAEQKTRAQTALEQMQVAIDEAAAETDELNDDPSLSEHAQAVRNLDARDATFRRLTHEERCFGARVKKEVERVRERRLRLASSREDSTRLLADAQSVAPPKVDVQPMHRPTDGVTLAQIRMYPPAPWARSDGDVARCISYFTQLYGPLYSSKRWEDQNAEAVAFINSLYAAEGVRNYPAARGA